MQSGEGEVLDGSHKFGQPRRRKIQNMLAGQSIEILPLSGPPIKRHSIEEMNDIFTEVVDPVIEILNKEGDEDGARRVRQRCTDALLKAIDKEAIRLLAEQELARIDPRLLAQLHDTPPDAS